jgi:hypothetical protein
MKTKLNPVDPLAALRSQIGYWVATHPDDSKATSTAGFATTHGRGVPYADLKRLFDEAYDKTASGA